MAADKVEIVVAVYIRAHGDLGVRSIKETLLGVVCRRARGCGGVRLLEVGLHRSNNIKL